MSRRSALVIGAGLAAIHLARGQTWAILAVPSSRSEFVALLRGDTPDERRTLIHLRASSAEAARWSKINAPSSARARG